MRIAELAEQARVKVSTVRFYERRGFLAQPLRTPSGYRDYDQNALRQLRFVEALAAPMVELPAGR